MLGYINSTAVVSEGLQAAHAHAAEYSLPAPDATVGQLLTTLTASATHPDNPKSAGVIAVSPASSVVGLYLLQGQTKVCSPALTLKWNISNTPSKLFVKPGMDHHGFASCPRARST